MPAVNRTNTDYLTIVQGQFKRKAEPETEGATLRSYELKDGTKGSKWEYSYDAWVGTIKDIQFEDTKFGKVIKLTFDDCVMQINKQSRYFASILEKLPNIDFNSEVEITPYSFEADGKQRTGVSIKQAGEKLKSYFFDGEKTTNGCPDGVGVNFKDSDEAKIFFMQRDKFLIDYTTEHVIPKLGVKVGDMNNAELKKELGIDKPETKDDEIPTIEVPEHDDTDVPF